MSFYKSIHQSTLESSFRPLQEAVALKPKVFVNTSKNKIRCFVAAWPPPALKSSLAFIQQEIGCSNKITWIPEEKIHLTLQFLGHISSDQLPVFRKELKNAVKNFPPVHLEAIAVGAFPSLKKPRVIWVGLKGQTAELKVLQQSIVDMSAKIGVIPDDRPYSPHLTLGRVKELNSKELADVSK